MKSPETTTSAARRNSASPNPSANPADNPTANPAGSPPEPPTAGSAPGSVALTESGRSRRRSGTAKNPDGIEIFYEVTGEPSGRPPPATTLLLCDGLGCDGYVWKYLQWALAADYRLVHFHYRGHGHSALPTDLQHIKLADFTRDALTVLDACQIDRAVFCGHSMGVQVALEAFKLAPQRVAGLVLICGSFGHPLRTFKGSDRLESLLPLLRATVSRVPSLVGALWRRAIPTELSYYIAQRVEIDGQLVRREDFFPYLESVARMDPRMFICTVAAAGQHSARDILPSIDKPTLIIAGRRDTFTPMALSVEMQQQIPGSILHVVEQGTHTSPIERPAEVSEVIAAFLKQRLPAPAPSAEP